jgi:predicted dehydrogenase
MVRLSSLIVKGSKRSAHPSTDQQFAPVDPYQLMVEHFAEVIQNKASLRYPAQEALQTLQVLDTIRATTSAAL